MGRLFWKFLVTFWGTLLVAALGVGFAVRSYERAKADAPGPPAADPRAELLVAGAAATLRHGGPEALRSLLAEQAERSARRLYAVDAGGRELLGRTVPADALVRARDDATAERPSSAARRVQATDGQSWLLFVAAEPPRAAPVDSPPRAPDLFFPPKPPPRDGLPGAPPDGPLGASPGRPPGRPPDALPDEPPDARAPPGPRGPPPPLLSLATGLIAGLGFSGLLAWYVSRPIRHLRRAFEAAAQGHLDTRVQPKIGARRDEIADLGRDFDRMVHQLQILVASQRRLLHDLSHELRSPLARLQAAAGLARQDPARLDASLGRIERESARLDQLIGQMLRLSRLEAGTDPEPLALTDLSELVAAIADDAHFEAQAKGCAVHFEGAGDTRVEMRPEMIHGACENVIRNAVKFTAPGSLVEVRVAGTPDGRCAVLTVADRGPGVPPAELDTIFTPFQRGANGRGVEGFGLGLAIARQAVAMHGGTIRAANRSAGGLCVEIVLPRAQPLPRAGDGHA